MIRAILSTIVATEFEFYANSYENKHISITFFLPKSTPWKLKCLMTSSKKNTKMPCWKYDRNMEGEGVGIGAARAYSPSAYANLF